MISRLFAALDAFDAPLPPPSIAAGGAIVTVAVCPVCGCPEEPGVAAHLDPATGAYLCEP